MAKLPAWYWTWQAWKDHGSPPPRPASAPKTIPAWAKARYALHKAVHPKPPPPLPTPKSPWTNPPWAHRGVHVAWGFRAGFATGSYTPAQLAAQLKTHNYAWSALEGFPDTENDPYHSAYKDALHGVGLKYGIWERTDQMTLDQVMASIIMKKPDFYLADIEVFPIVDPRIPEQIAKQFPNLPRAVFIAGMPDASYCKPWVDAGFDCMTQAYSGPNHFDPVVGIAGGMDSDAKWRGWPINANGTHTWPCLEVHAEGSADLKTQLPAVAQWGDNYSVYLAELMQPDDWLV